MRIHGKHYRTLWPHVDGGSVEIIDQTALPFTFRILRLCTLGDVVHAIATMQVRGAPLIGAAAAYGAALAMMTDASDGALDAACAALVGTRPTAVNLRWAVTQMRDALVAVPRSERATLAWQRAAALCDDDVTQCRAIGEHGVGLLREAYTRKGNTGVLNVLTHCNAGWLATVDYGTALAPVYAAHDAGLPVHVWCDETRPRNQGASLTAWELAEHGVAHTVIVDNAGGHLMQAGKVDLCIVGTDRTACNGDVCNKIGTYLKALAAYDNQVPFYVAAPQSSIDWTLPRGVGLIPIEERAAAEVHSVTGVDAAHHLTTVRVMPLASAVANPAFDVTPARLVTAIITERGVAAASNAGLLTLYPEHQ